MSDDYSSGYHNPDRSHAAGSDAYAGARQRERDEAFNSFYRQPWTAGTRSGPATLTSGTSSTSAEIGAALGAISVSMDDASPVDLIIGVFKFVVGAGLAYMAYSLRQVDWVTAGVGLGSLYLMCSGFPAVFKLFVFLVKVALCLGVVFGLMYIFMDLQPKVKPETRSGRTTSYSADIVSANVTAPESVSISRVSPKYATVATENLKLRSCPFERSDCLTVATMPEGLQVTIIGPVRNGWYEVEAPGGGKKTYRGFAFGGRLSFQ